MMFGGFLGMNLLFWILFALVSGIILVSIFKGIGEWNRNNHAPRLTVPATVVSRRIRVTHHHHGGTSVHHQHVHTVTTYYVTFQLENGERMEFQVSGEQYGLLTEHDRGNLDFQGTRFLDFTRT